MKQRATAIAIATLMVAAGLSLVPPAVSAAPGDCSEDFEIAESESDASTRRLPANSLEIGKADVEAGSPEDLMVELETSNDALDVAVFHKDATGSCVEFDSTNCRQTVTSTGNTFICELDDPLTGTKNYWAHYENDENDRLDYHTWNRPA